MLKKINTHSLVFHALVYKFVNSLYKILFITWHFWSFFPFDQNIMLILFKRKYFFFKFIQVKKRIHFHRKRRRQPKKIRKKKPVYIIKWALNSIFIKTSQLRNKYKRFIAPRILRRWLRHNFRRKTFPKTNKKFLRLLRQKILWSNLYVGSILFRTNKKKNLKKIFQVFRGANNFNKLQLLFKYKYFLAYIIYKFLWRYNNLYYYYCLKQHSSISILYFNLHNFLLFKRRKKRRFRRYNFKKIFSKKRRRKKKKANWLYYRKKKIRRRHRRMLFKRFTKSLLFYKDPMTQLYSFHPSRNIYTTHYLSFFINLWNIRSYNWKQIT